MNAVTEIAPLVGIVLACTMLAVARATYYRTLRPRTPPAPRPRPPRALGADERQAVLDVLHEPRFVDLAPVEVYATLLDESRYLCSERTMYRILAANQEVRERRDQLRHQNHPRPELLATRPNELWSWDILRQRRLRLLAERREPHQPHTAIALEAPALDQALLLEAVDDPGRVRRVAPPLLGE